MPINHAADKAALLALFTDMRGGEKTDSENADSFATVIENIILSATPTLPGVQSGGSTISGTMS